ncbi:putative reverse transcriptase domain-containing protein [Tanacetum coccineum]
MTMSFRLRSSHYLPIDSPTAESPGYVTESDPEEDPEEYEDDETEDDDERRRRSLSSGRLFANVEPVDEPVFPPERTEPVIPSPPLPPLPPFLYIPPPVDRRDDIPESEQPPRKRCWGTGLGTPWVDPAEAVLEIAPMTGGEVNTRITELAELHERHNTGLVCLLLEGCSRIVGDSIGCEEESLCFPRAWASLDRASGPDGRDSYIESSRYKGKKKSDKRQAELFITARASERKQPSRTKVIVQGKLKQIMAPTTRRGPNTPVNDTNPNNMTPESIQAMIDQALLETPPMEMEATVRTGITRRNSARTQDDRMKTIELAMNLMESENSAPTRKGQSDNKRKADDFITKQPWSPTQPFQEAKYPPGKRRTSRKMRNNRRTYQSSSDFPEEPQHRSIAPRHRIDWLPSEIKELSKQLQNFHFLTRGFIGLVPCLWEPRSIFGQKEGWGRSDVIDYDPVFNRKIYSRSGYHQLREYRADIPKRHFALGMPINEFQDAPILALPEGSEDFVVYCDASHKGLGAVLMQREKVYCRSSFSTVKSSEKNSHHSEI